MRLCPISCNTLGNPFKRIQCSTHLSPIEKIALEIFSSVSLGAGVAWAAMNFVVTPYIILGAVVGLVVGIGIAFMLSRSKNPIPINDDLQISFIHPQPVTGIHHRRPAISQPEYPQSNLTSITSSPEPAPVPSTPNSQEIENTESSEPEISIVIHQDPEVTVPEAIGYELEIVIHTSDETNYP